MTILRPVLRRALLRRVLTSLTDDEGAGPTITGAGSIDVSTFEVGTTQTITAGTATATGGGTVTYEYRHLAGGEVKSTSAAYAHVSGDVGESAAAQWRAVESGGTNDGATSWQTVATGTVVAQAAPAATGVESASEVGTAVFASMSSPAALGVESVSEVGFAALASSFAPAATGVESTSEVGAAVFMGMSAPAATGIESASEVGTASPPSADTTAPVMTSDSYNEGTRTFSATITETESLPVTMHVLVSATEPTTADDIINGTGLFKTTYTVAAGANSDELEFSTVAAGTHWLGILPVDAADNSDFAQAHVAQYTFPGGYVATGVESTSEVGSAVFSGMSAPAATGIESASEVGSPAAPAEVPAALGVESASEVGTASPPSAGGASGNFTFSLAQFERYETMGDPAQVTMTSAITAGNLLVCVMGERSGGDPATHTVTDSNGKTWTRASDLNIDNSVGGDESNTRMTASTWWREVDSSGETSSTPTISADDGTSNSKSMFVVEVAPSATYGWTYGNGVVAGSGASDWDNLSSGSVSTTGDDLLVMGVSASRLSSDRPGRVNIGFDEYSTGDTSEGNSNQMAFSIGFLTTSQADSSSYASTVDTGGNGSGNEGICGTILFKDV